MWRTVVAHLAGASAFARGIGAPIQPPKAPVVVPLQSKSPRRLPHIVIRDVYRHSSSSRRRVVTQGFGGDKVMQQAFVQHSFVCRLWRLLDAQRMIETHAGTGGSAARHKR
ncbi:hypothetical protein BU23DRAFT_61669 [Bimuria novae-zelandiae CBS 107.79]|uniref:Uncharacterized protein n=1 Tax=Bimuria novae-zelandiae CBS 107.79 TaxID=1447943 RepID=A0A6A5UKH5_9PLEO|nr:hypothetical protein BU23DRAFT_61669 [Bimuria novae-zelandiae CBS 107.79]